MTCVERPVGSAIAKGRQERQARHNGAMRAQPWRVGFLLAVLVGALGAMQARRPMQELVFLTRDGCVNTPDMMTNLDDALIALGWRRDYQEIDIGKLPRSDARTGYPTPTLLWKGRDIFGLPIPKPPYPTPT